MGKCHDCKQQKQLYDWKVFGRVLSLCQQCIDDRRETQKSAIRATYGTILQGRK